MDRKHASKKDVRIYDYIEHNEPQLTRMWSKRQLGYRAMGYAVLQNERREVEQIAF